MSQLIVHGAEYLFWMCLVLVCYAYFIYPLALFIASSLAQTARDLGYLRHRHNRRSGSLASEQVPSASLIVAAYNEEEILPEKIANLRQLDYPASKLEVIFISDGSTDRTNEILSSMRLPNARTIVLPSRKGKAHALNCGVEAARHEILIFSDASTLFEPSSLRRMVRHFSDPRVGVVCGALQFRGSRESRQTEGVYWKYEGMLRLMEGRLGATLTASGALYALRRQCYPHLSSQTWIEDFVVPMMARKLGYKVLYEPEAVATEFAAPTVEGEFARRVRIAIGSFRALGELSRIPLDAVTLWAFFSHKVLRWILPFLLIALLVSNAVLWNQPVYSLALFGQLLFYLWAAVGFAFRDRAHRVRYALLGYFLVAMNLAFLVGFVRTVVGSQEVTWQRVN
jgi:cellulose synthase/poly-beta-1,6-N-acetylglucosamine synthase-like glycosyltransferase